MEETMDDVSSVTSDSSLIVVTDTNNSYFEGLDEELIDSDLTSSGEIILTDIVGKYYFVQYTDKVEGFCQIFICKGKQSASFYFFNTSDSKLTFEQQLQDFELYLETIEFP